MRVLYDYQAFQMQKYGGVSRCFMELFNHLPQDIHAEIGIRESDNAYIKGMNGIKSVGYQYENFICRRHFYAKGRLHKLYDKLTHGGYYPDYNQNFSVQLLQTGNYDVFHPTFFGDYFLPYLNGKPFVLTIHDMISELYPQYFGEKNLQSTMKKALVPYASAIIAVSETTKRDIIEILEVPEEKVHVVYHGCSFPQTSDVCPSISGNILYLLYVGERKGYKNFALFVKYIVPFLRSHSDVSVVCTGSDFSDDEKKMFVDLGVSDRFIHYWVSSDEEFFSLYHYALCFVYTSEYEGFGIPILEAYQADCPVLLNHASCFPEIAGDAAMYFKMTPDESDILEKLETIFSFSEEQRESLLSKQRERLSRYSWTKSANQLADIYRRIANK